MVSSYRNHVEFQERHTRRESFILRIVNNLEPIHFVGLFLLFIFFLRGCVGINYAFTTTNFENVIIRDMSVKRKDNNSDIYLVFTDKGEFSIEDSFVWGRWDSSTMYNQLLVIKEKKQPINLVCQGYRLPVLSFYPNIVGITTESK